MTKWHVLSVHRSTAVVHHMRLFSSMGIFGFLVFSWFPCTGPCKVEDAFEELNLVVVVSQFRDGNRL